MVDDLPPDEGTKAAVPAASASSIPARQSTEPETKATKAKAFLLVNNTVMRSSPSRGASKLNVIPGGTKLMVVEWDGSWARVVLADGRSGWINVR